MTNVRKGNALPPSPSKIAPVAAGFQCAGCGEWNDISIDTAAARRQVYVEDCQVCCRPNVLTVEYDRDTEEFSVTAVLES
jgi:Cysteine-rich CPXCG